MTAERAPQEVSAGGARGDRTMDVRLEELREVLAARPAVGRPWNPRLPWTGGASLDSRRVRPGEIFFALRGRQTDGHLFVDDALARGAAAAVVAEAIWGERERAHGEGGEGGEAAGATGAAGAVLVVADPVRALQELARWHRSRLAVRVVAVTGSVGKTTTKEMTARALASRFRTAATEGNLNNHLGVPLTVLALRPEDEVAVVEFGASRAGDIGLLCGIARPEFGVITCVAEAHLEFFGTVEGVLRAKWELAEGLVPGGVMLVNGDDARLRARAAEWGGRVVTYGLQAGLDVAGEDALPVDAARRPPGASLRVAGVPVRLRVLGRGALLGALGALAAARELGAPLAPAARALEEVPPLPGRLYPHLCGETVLLDDTYNASPLAVANALEVLADWPGAGRRILAFGGMLELGADSARAHREVGRRAAAAGTDLMFLCGDGAEEVGAGAREGGLAADRITIAPGREELARALARAMAPGDVILLKASRGGRLDEVTAALLAGRSGGGARA